MPLLTKGLKDAAGNIHALVDGQMISFPSDHPAYTKIDQAITSGNTTLLLAYSDVPTALKHFSCGRLLVDGDKVSINLAGEGEAPRYHSVDNVIAHRAIELMRQDLPFEPLLRFLDNLMKNPSRRAVQELYPWLKHRAVPLADDGSLLSYKRVTDDGTSFSTGPNSTTVVYPDGRIEVIPPHTPVPYPIGGRVFVERNEVDENWGVACSEGIHVGDISYVNSFHGGQGKILIVKFFPQDVVTVPSNETNKLRVTEVLPLAYYTGDMTIPLYTADAQPYEIAIFDQARKTESLVDKFEDESFEDESYEDDYGEDEEEEADEEEGHSYKVLVDSCSVCRKSFRKECNSLVLTTEDIDGNQSAWLGCGDSAEGKIYIDSESGGMGYDLLKEGALLAVRCAGCGAPVSALVAHYARGERVGTLSTPKDLMPVEEVVPVNGGAGEAKPDGLFGQLFGRIFGRR